MIRDGELNDDDHCYCEFDSGEKSFVPTDEEPTIDMSADEVVQLFKEAKDKWNPSRYDPFLGWG